MNASVNLPPDFLTAIQNIVGEQRVKTDTDALMTWGKDWTKHFEPNPSVIVFPSTTQEVADLVKIANQFNIAITPSGGRTG